MIFSDIVLALIDAAHDKDEQVQTTVQNSLKKIGLQQPQLVLSSSLHYLVNHPKVFRDIFLIDRSFLSNCVYFLRYILFKLSPLHFL